MSCFRIAIGVLRQKTPNQTSSLWFNRYFAHGLRYKPSTLYFDLNTCHLFGLINHRSIHCSSVDSKKMTDQSRNVWILKGKISSSLNAYSKFPGCELFPVSTQNLATIGLPAKSHPYGIALTGPIVAHTPYSFILMVASQLSLKSSQPMSQVGPGSTRPESTRPGVFSGGLYRYFPAWQIKLKWQILANNGKYNFFAVKYWQI